MKRVMPTPSLAALTGVLLEVDAGELLVEVVLDGFLLEPEFEPDVTVVFGRLRLGFAVLPLVAGFSFGREVKKAPRTSSWSCATDGIETSARALMHNTPRAKLLNFIPDSFADILHPAGHL